MANLEQSDRPQEQPSRLPEQSPVNETQDYQRSNPAMFRADQSANDKLISSGTLPAISFGQFDGRYDSNKIMGQQNGFKFDDGIKAFEGGHSLTSGIMLTRDSATRVATREVEPGIAAGRSGEAVRQGERPSQPENNKAALTSKLMDVSATPQEKLAAARELIKSGVTKIDTTMQDGSKASLRLDSQKSGSKEMVHVFVNKGSRENVALRGNFDESGALSKQFNGGKTYAYEGKGQRDLGRMSFRPGNGADQRAPEAPQAPQARAQERAPEAPQAAQAKVQERAPEAPQAQAPASRERPVWPRIINKPEADKQEQAPEAPRTQKPEVKTTPEVRPETKDSQSPPAKEAPVKPGDNTQQPQTETKTEATKPEQIRLKGGLRPIVVLDAGHGGKDTGAVVGGTKEKDLTRALNDLVTKKLQDRGVFVEHTNPTDNYISPTERRDRADRERGAIAGRKPEHQCQADAAISIHANHDGVNKNGGGTTRGMEILLNGGKGKDGTLDLAKSIQGSVNKEREAGLDVVDGGLRNRPGLAFTKALSPTVLVEAGYMTNNRDLANLKDPVYREKLATAITNGIAQFLQNRPANCRK